MHRYDALFVFAIVTQALILRCRLETWNEARVILLLHLTGTAMELFKVNPGSWSYPEPAKHKLFGGPPFSGFPYVRVGSYMARVIRICDRHFAPCPPFWMTMLMSVAIHVDFFAHHFLPDIRVALFAATLVAWARKQVWFRTSDRNWRMPSSLVLWVAETIGRRLGHGLMQGRRRTTGPASESSGPGIFCCVSPFPR